MAASIDLSQMTVSERIAFNMDIKYSSMQGNIGMVCNSAGLCMATNDAIINAGGLPANFSDLGGSAIHEQIHALLSLVNNDSNVKVIFIHCYGGITNIKKVFATLAMCLKTETVTKPIVIRTLGLESRGSQEILSEWQGKHPIFLEPNFN